MRVNTISRLEWVYLTIVFVFVLFGWLLYYNAYNGPSSKETNKQLDSVPSLHSAALQVAVLFGKIPACADKYNLMDVIAREAIANSIPPKLVAAIVVTESRCDTLAVSEKGAIGLMQISVSTWRNKYDFTSLNLFNPDTNIHIGTAILGSLYKQYGLIKTLDRYQGQGLNSDPTYTSKVINLTGGTK